MFFGHHVINQAATDNVSDNIEAAQESINRSNPGTIKTNESGDLEVKGANGTKVTVHGLPTTGQ